MTALLLATGLVLAPLGLYVALNVWRPTGQMEGEELETYLVRIFVWPWLGPLIPFSLFVLGLMGGDASSGVGVGAVVVGVGAELLLFGIARRQRARRRAS